MQHWLYLSFPCLSLDMRFRNGLQQGSPVAIYRPERNALIQVNPAAKQLGIKPGMGMAEAAALSADLIIYRFDEKKQLDYLKLLANRVYQVASDIVLDKSHALAVRMDNMNALYTSCVELISIVLDSLSGLISEYNYADGWNIETARLLAHSGANRCLGTYQAIYDAVIACPLSATELPDNTVSQLSRIGIKTFDNLLSLPFSELSNRLDNRSLQAIVKIRETQVVSPSIYYPENHFSHSMDTPFDFESTKHCRRLICALLDELEVYLRVRNWVTSEITLRLTYRDTPVFTHSIQSATPISKASHWLMLTDTWLDCLVLPEPVIAIGLVCKNVEPDSGGETDLFNNRHSYFLQAQLISRLKTRLGDAAVEQPKPFNDHRFNQLSSSVSQNAQAYITDDCPLFSLARPVPLKDNSKIIFGPHRIQTGWWDTHCVDRDYFIAVTDQGRYLQVCRDEEKRWLVTGVYC